MNISWQTTVVCIILFFSAFRIYRSIKRETQPVTNAQKINAMYEWKWHNDSEEVEQAVMGTLKKYDIKYSSFYIKKSMKNSGDAVVALTKNDTTYQFYNFKYDPHANQSGMLTPIEDDGIPKPH